MPPRSFGSKRLRVVASAAVLGCAFPARAAEPDEPVRVALEIDPTALPPSRTPVDIVEWISGAVSTTLSETDIVVDENAGTKVRLVLSRFGEHDIHYRLDAGIVMPSRSDLQYVRQLDCEACSDTEMVEMVSRYAASAAGWLHSAAARDAVEDDATTDDPIAEIPPAQLDAPALGRLGIVGASVGAVGLAGVVAGAALLVHGRRESLDASDNELLNVTDLRPPGIAVLVSGGALLVTGVVLLAVDRSRRKRRATAMTPSPLWTRGGIGLTLSGRF